MKKYFLVFLVCIIFIFSSCVVMKNVGDVMSGFGSIYDSPYMYMIGEVTSALASASSPISTSQEYYIGRAVAANILNKYDVYENAIITEYVNKICQVLAINSGCPELYKGYSVCLLNTNEINAFATPGGHILITRGFLECMKNEDALASIIAHEMAHIQLKHGINSIKTDRWRNAFIKAGGASVLFAFEDSFDEIDTENLEDFIACADIFSEGLNYGYAKELEFEADKMALSLLSFAGYNPNAIIEMLELIETDSDYSLGGLFNTHPSPTDRIKNIQKNAVPSYTFEKGFEYRQQRFNLVMKDF